MGPYGDYGYSRSNGRKGDVPYHRIGGPHGLLARCKSFAGNSLSAEWNRTVYRVYSYNTLIAEFRPPNGDDEGRDLYEVLRLDESYYSVTTARHQSLIRSWLARDIVGPDVAVGGW